MPTSLWYLILAITIAMSLPVLAVAVAGPRSGPMAPYVGAQSAVISWINNAIGITVAWLTLFMVLVQFAVVVMRYAFGFNLIALQESVIYAHGVMFMMAAAYTLFVGGHVRVDVFYQSMSPQRKALVDLIGSLFFLVPFALVILTYSWGYVESSWRIQEASRESSGLPGVYLLKTVILLFAGLLLLQGLALAGRSALILRGLREPEPS